MTINAAIWVMVVYVAIYYFLARAVLFQVNERDADNQPTPIFSSGESWSIIDMIFDTDLPEHDSSPFVRYGLYTVRVMVAVYLPLLAAMLWLADWK